jgi:predicted nucleotidyltransferase
VTEEDPGNPPERRTTDDGSTLRAPEDDILERIEARRRAGEAPPTAPDGAEDPLDPRRFHVPITTGVEDEPAVFEESVDTIRQWLEAGRELPRTTVVGALHGALAQQEWAVAAWLGGSDAYGRVDRWSDIDLFVEVADDHLEDAFSVVEKTLEEIAGIEQRWDVPQPTWHRGPERIYRLVTASPYLLVDTAVVPVSHGRAALIADRHGVARFLFDNAESPRPEDIDGDSIGSMIDAHLLDLRVRVPMLRVMVDKELLRGDALGAMEMFRRFMHGPLIELVRMRYTPERWDFGLRFARRDLPADVASRLERLLYVADLDDLRESWLEARRWMMDLLEALANGPLSGQPSEQPTE